MKARDSQPGADTIDDAPASVEASPCFDVIDVLDGFCTVEKRSRTLNGSIPLRAAQGCIPFLEGNAAGFQIRLAEPALLQVEGGDPRFHLADDSFAKVGADYSANLQRAVSAGVLENGGFWHRTLRRGAVQRRRRSLMLWTGLLVRPAPGVWVLQSGAFNRRSRVTVADTVLADDTAFVPVILDIDLSSIPADGAWLRSDLACLTPLSPHVSFDIETIEEHPEAGEAFVEYHSRGFAERRAGKQAAGDYRRLAHAQPNVGVTDHANSRLIVAGGPKHHRVGTFKRFVTRDGASSAHPKQADLQFATVRNSFAISGYSDGREVHELSVELPLRATATLRRTWSRLYGDDALVVCDQQITGYANQLAAPSQEPLVAVAPWALVTTPPGWLCLADGYHRDGVDGLRGVVATDAYFHAIAALQCDGSGPFTIPRGALLQRLLPVPRRLLQAPLRLHTLDDLPKPL